MHTLRNADETIIELLRSRNADGVSLLYDKYSGALFGTIVRVVQSKELAEEVLQDTFTKAWRNIDSYDTSKGRLYTWLINIARNAAQAIQEQPKSDDVSLPSEIIFRTRAVRQVTLAKRRYRLAIELQIVDNGPGIPEAIREQIFYPLVSGREGGSGLGLTLAQSFIQQHHGMIEVESQSGRTCFTVLLPIHATQEEHK